MLLIGSGSPSANRSGRSACTSIAVARPSRRISAASWPVAGARLVEVTRTVLTDPAVLSDVTTFVEGLGRTTVTVTDRPGHIVDSLLFPYLNNALGMLEASYATREDIDAAMRFGCGYPIGPLALLDLIGLDAAYEILSRDPRSCTGNFFIDDEVLAEAGIADLDQYAGSADGDLALDVFVDGWPEPATPGV